MEMLLQTIILVVGFAFLVKGADWFVEGVSGIAEKFGIPQLVIGLTIVAMGTSAPEAAVSITAALKGNAGITVGNIVGSNILNILIILGITGFLVNVAVAKSTLLYEIPYMLLITLVLLVMGMTGQSISFVEGVVLWGLFLIYLFYLYRMAKDGKSQTENAGGSGTECADRTDIGMIEDSERNDGKSAECDGEQGRDLKKNSWFLLGMAVVGGVLIIGGSSLTVDSATYLARILGLSERFIGLTIVALGTSLPELFTSVTAALKGKADIAIGNIVGSNIFNILFVIGTTAFITPVIFEPKFLIDTIVAVGAGVLLWVSVCRTRTLKRSWGIIMLVGYAGYLWYLLAM